VSKEFRLISISPLHFPAEGEAQAPPPAVETAKDNMSDIVRNIYIRVRKATLDSGYGKRAMAKWDGGVDKFGNNHTTPVWPALAAHIAGVGADPLEYIVAQFKHSRSDRAPLPNQMSNQKATDKWASANKHAAPRLRDMITRELNSIDGMASLLVAELEWDKTRAMRYALKDTSDVVAGDVVRYCLATACKFDDISERYYEQAVVDYTFQKRLYDQVWIDSIPVSLQEAGKALVERLSS